VRREDAVLFGFVAVALVTLVALIYFASILLTIM